MISPTHFAAALLGLSPSPPPLDRQAKRHYGIDPLCWLCGGPTERQGWRHEDAIADTFTQHNLAAVTDSATICWQCVAFTTPASFQALVKARSMPIKTTTKDGRPWVQAGWHCYSHFFAAPDRWECPGPGRVREILLDPPRDEFLLTINPTGKKHTLFRCRISTSPDAFFVHFEDETFLVHALDAVRCMIDFEHMSRLGFSKEQTLSGRYSQYQILQAGIETWRAGEGRIATWRTMRPSLLGLVAWCALGPSKLREIEPPAEAAPAPAPKTVYKEDLFG